MLGTNLTFKTYIGYFELFGERVPLREIKKRLRASKLSNIVGELARINQCLNARACDDPDVIYSFNTFPWKKYFPSFGTQEDEEVRVRSEAVLRRVRKTIFGSSGAQATP